MRICFIGDSFVNGTGCDDALGWVGRVVAEARGRGRDVTAYNLGIRGDTSADIGARWRAEAERRLPPQHDGRLVFSFGANDCCHNDIDGGPRIDGRASLAHAGAILRAARGWLPTLMTGPPGMADPLVDDRVRMLATTYAELCRQLGVPFLDIARLTTESAAWMREVRQGDGAHPNRGGYSVVAGAVIGWPAWRAWTDG